MLNFKNTNIFFVALLIFLIGYDLLYPLPVWVYLITLMVYVSILAYGSYYIGAGFYIKSICAVKTAAKQIAISFDDGPANEYTAEILKVLKEQRVQAAFFCIGNRIRGNGSLLKQIHEEGHVIGNHSYSHDMWFDLFSSGKMSADLRMMDLTVEDSIGLRPRFFRPPYGVTNPNLKKAIIRGRYISVGWSIRSMDTVIKDEQRLLQRVMRSVKPGAIVLFHDTSRTTLGILPVFIKQLAASGYEIVRLDKMLKLDPYV
jgi:peptidoglycan/xylan/chitin deacetylase (PgdA/CDA1 family)